MITEATALTGQGGDPLPGQPLQARKGRASYLGERSIGHQDPGAASTALILRALERAVGRRTEPAGRGRRHGARGDHMSQRDLVLASLIRCPDRPPPKERPTS